MLWFAWKIVLLQYRKQLKQLHFYWSICCDLLEKSYFCSIANNPSTGNVPQRPVVICLKNSTFAVSQTTIPQTGAAGEELWFAWKIVLLQYRKQQMLVVCRILLSCDLLEKSYFCSIANNRPRYVMRWWWLWFAWKIVLLQYRKQQVRNFRHGNVVVICLKNRTFAVSQTTGWGLFAECLWLWFAWKIVLLQYRKQPILVVDMPHERCDLLEKSYFCSIANNFQVFD